MGGDFPGYPYETLLHMDWAGYTISQYWLINLLTWDISQQRLPHSYVKCPFLCLHKQLINSPKPEFPSSSFSNYLVYVNKAVYHIICQCMHDSDVM